MNVDELRRGLHDLAASEPVDVAAARRQLTAQAAARRPAKARPLLVAVAAAAVLLVAAVVLLARNPHGVRVTTHPGPTTLPTPSTSTTVRPPAVGVAQRLVFTGAASGTVTTATVADYGEVVSPTTTKPTGTPACTNVRPPDQSAPNQAIVGLHATLAERPLLFWWIVGDVHSPASGFAEAGFTFAGTTYQFDPAAVSADPDRLGGTVDTAYSTAFGGPAAGKVTGHFRCAAAVLSTTPTTAPAVALVSGPYGFLVPSGWSETPLHNVGGGHVASATFTSPDGSGRVVYQLNGGSFSGIYNADQSRNLVGANTRISCLTSTRSVAGPNAVSYTCQTTTPGMTTKGVVIIEPYPEGTKQLEVTVPDAESAVADRILASVH